MLTRAGRKVIYLALFAITVATAKASVRFHVCSRGANVHLSPITARNISPNPDALRPGAGRRDRFAAERAMRDRLSQRLIRPVFIRAFTR
jgi:hypothetical protein